MFYLRHIVKVLDIIKSHTFRKFGLDSMWFATSPEYTRKVC